MSNQTSKRRKTSSLCNPSSFTRADSVADQVALFRTLKSNCTRKRTAAARSPDHTWSNHFNKLPIEINQHVAGFLINDHDIKTFTQICRSTRDAIDKDNMTFWRRRYLQLFDEPLQPICNLQFKNMYKIRQYFLNDPPVFRLGRTKREIKCLKVLRDIILECWSSDAITHQRVESLNIQYLREFGNGCPSLLHEIFIPHSKSRTDRGLPEQADPLLTTIQVLLAPLILLVHDVDHSVYSFSDSQRAAYGTSSAMPIFYGPGNLTIDMTWALHQLNFWKFHLTREHEFTLYGAFTSLTSSETPNFWRQSLVRTAAHLKPIGRQWKGCYAFVEHAELQAIRLGRGASEMIADEFNGEQTDRVFQDLILELSDEGEASWPELFESCLHALELPSRPASRSKTRAQRRSADSESLPSDPPCRIRFRGCGLDGTEDFRTDGWLSAMPPQSGIPGFQRLTMMKFYYDNQGNLDIDALWAYEGVVLPGGQIIVGRWWSPDTGIDDDQYSGPFILWCVDPQAKLRQCEGQSEEVEKMPRD